MKQWFSAVATGMNLADKLNEIESEGYTIFSLVNRDSFNSFTIVYYSNN